MSSLQGLQGKKFDTNYITAMVNGHQQALTNIDQNILPNIQNAKLKAFVEATRKHVEMHYNVAKEVLNTLNS